MDNKIQVYDEVRFFLFWNNSYCVFSSVFFKAILVAFFGTRYGIIVCPEKVKLTYVFMKLMLLLNIHEGLQPVEISS